MTPSLQAQFAHACDPDSVAFETAFERDLPYHAETPHFVSLPAFTAMAGLALVEFHNVWMRFTEGNNHG